MVDGLWTVEFISVTNRFGKGILVLLPNGRLVGGDSAYYYSGNYKTENSKIIGNAFVIRYDPTGMSVFGDLDSFKLSFCGQINNSHFSAGGSIDNMPDIKIRIVGNKKEDF